jgi:hypothetical protein
LAGNDAKFRFAGRLHLAHGNRIDAGHGGRIRSQALKEFIEFLARALNFNGDSVGIIADRT